MIKSGYAFSEYVFSKTLPFFEKPGLPNSANCPSENSLPGSESGGNGTDRRKLNNEIK
jgi:hypothetical protein